MKKILQSITNIVGLTLILLISNLSFCQGVYTSWAHATSGPIGTWGSQITVDDSGNSFVAGIFYGQTDFDPGINTAILDGGNEDDGFISKYDNLGNLIWAKQIICDNTLTIRSLARDASNNIIVTGEFNGTITFDVMQSGTTHTALGYSDIFIAKYNSNGILLWSSQVGGTSTENSYSIKTDILGNIYTTGYFQGTIDFDPGTNSFNMTATGGNPQQNTFILKLDSNGQFGWAKQFIGGSNYSFSSECNTNGDIFVSGMFHGTVDFDPSTNINNLTSGTYGDFFICKLNSSGQFIWSKQMACSQQSYIQTMELDFNGNILLSGGFKGTTDFDPGTGLNELTSNGNYDIFALKLDGNGTFIWAQQIGGTESDFCQSICSNNTGAVFFGGYFNGNVDFDPGASSFNVTSQSKDMFVLKLNGNGNFEWAEVLGGNSYEEISSISTVSTTNDIIYLTGYFGGSTDMNGGAGQLNFTSLNGGSAAVTAKLIPCSPLNSSLNINACESYLWNVNNQTYNTAGTYSATIESINGCDSTITLNLSITNLVNTVNQSSNVLTATQSGATYSWVDCNNSNQPIAGATSQTYTATANGSYAVIVEQNGCTVTSNCVAITTVGLDDIKTDLFRVYPNPTSTVINVEMENASTIRLFDVSGKLLKELNGASIYSIDVTDLKPGMYMIESSEGAKAKFIKE